MPKMFKALQHFYWENLPCCVFDMVGYICLLTCKNDQESPKRHYAGYILGLKEAKCKTAQKKRKLLHVPTGHGWRVLFTKSRHHTGGAVT